MSRFIYKYLMIATCLMVNCCAWAQEGIEILQKFDDRFCQLDSLIFKAVETHAAVESDPMLNTLGLSHSVIYDSIYAQAVANRTRAQIKEIDAETGLQATGQLYARLDNAFHIDDEEDPVSVYRAKAQAEMRWYFLQSALFQKKGRANEYKLKGDIDILAYEKERIDLTIYRQKELLRLRSDSLLAGILIHHVANLELLEQANLYLLNSESISSDDLLRIIDDKAKAQRELATMSRPFPAATSLGSYDCIVVDIDTARLLREIDKSQIDMRLLQLRMQLLDQQADNESWWRTARIAPFVRYSGYYTGANTISSNVDAGVSFTIPINTQSRRARQSIMAQKEITEAQSFDLKQQVSDKVRYLVQEIARLNQASVAEAERIKRLQDYLLMRRNAYDNRNGQYSRLSRMKEYDTYLSCLEKMIEFQYRRDNCIADLQTFLVDDSILKYCIVKFNP